MPSHQSRHKRLSSKQHLPGRQQPPGGQAPGKPTKQPASQGIQSTRPLQTTQPAPQPASTPQAPEQPSQGALITIERGQPREEQALMQTASSTITGRPHHRKVRSIHYTLSYELQGEEHGTDGAILLLHGLPGGAFSWRNIQPVLAAKRAVYALDMLSYGKSDHPWPADVSIWGQADVLAPCLRTLNLTNIVLVGYDVGGGVAQVLATRMAAERVGAVVLISTTCYAKAFGDHWPLPEMVSRQEPDAPRHTPTEQMIADLRATFPKGAVNPSRLTSEVLHHYIDPWNSELGKENLFQHIRKQLPNYSMSVASDMKWVNKPVLIIWGQQDEVLPVSYAERLHRDIPGSQLAVIPDTGHLVLEEAPEQVARLISEFVDTL